MSNLGRFLIGNIEVCLTKKIFLRGMVVFAKWEGRIDKMVPDGTVLQFEAGCFTLQYQIHRCTAFSSVSRALENVTGGFRKLVPHANSAEEALVVYHNCALYKNAALSRRLETPVTRADIDAATRWDASMHESGSVMFVWEGEVVYVQPTLPVIITQRPPYIPQYLACPFFSQSEDPRPGLLVIGMNYHDPSLLHQRDVLRMNLLQQLAPFLSVWGMSVERYADSGTWVQLDVRADQGWREPRTRLRLLATVIAMFCPNWLPAEYLRSNRLGLGYGDKLFTVTFSYYFVPGVKKVFFMPNDAVGVFEKMARDFYSKNPNSHIKSHRLPAQDVYSFNPLHRATCQGEEKGAYECTLDVEDKNKPRASEFKWLNKEFPYVMLYSGFSEEPNPLVAVKTFLDKACRHINPLIEVIAPPLREYEEDNAVPKPVSKLGPHPRLPANADIAVAKIRMLNVFHGKQKRTIWQVFERASNAWYTTAKARIDHIKFMGRKAVDYVLEHGEEVSLGSGDRTTSSDGLCVQASFHLLGHTDVSLPSHIPLKLCQCARVWCNPAFIILKPSVWALLAHVRYGQPMSISTFLACYQEGSYVLQVHVTDVDTDLHCIAVTGRLVADPSENIWRPLNEESFAILAIDAVVYGLEVRRVVRDGGMVDMQQAAGGIVRGGQGLPLKHLDAAVHVCLTSTHGCPESLADNTVVCGVKDNRVDEPSPAVPSGLLGRVLPTSATPSSHAQLCFNLLGEPVAPTPVPDTLKQWVHALRNHPCKPRGPSAWSMTTRLTNPMPVADFLLVYRPSRYVLQVKNVGKGLRFVAVFGQSLVDPAEGMWRPLTVVSFTQLLIAEIIYGVELAS